MASTRTFLIIMLLFFLLLCTILTIHRQRVKKVNIGIDNFQLKLCILYGIHFFFKKKVLMDTAVFLIFLTQSSLNVLGPVCIFFLCCKPESHHHIAPSIYILADCIRVTEEQAMDALSVLLSQIIST